MSSLPDEQTDRQTQIIGFYNPLQLPVRFLHHYASSSLHREEDFAPYEFAVSSSFGNSMNGARAVIIRQSTACGLWLPEARELEVEAF
jgi:hypothetical protein